MLVLFLILFQNVLVLCSDSSENKYVDLLPDKEKRQFMERVAKRILETIESKEHDPQRTISIPDEELKYQDFVSTILKEEIDIDNKRRSKGEVQKENKDEKPGSQEKENLDVKPLETEKISDDADLEQVDLTRHDQERRGGIEGAQAKSSDYINIEVDIDITKKPITKRSVQNETGIDDSVSDEVSFGSSENVELKTERTETLDPKILTSKDHNTTNNAVRNATTTSKVTETTTDQVQPIESLVGSMESEETPTTNTRLSKNETKVHVAIVESKNEEKSHEIFNNNGSSETDGEDIQVKIIENAKMRRSLSDLPNIEAMVNTTENSTQHPPFEYFTPNLTEHKSNEENSDMDSDIDVEGTTAVTADNTTVGSEAPTQKVDKVTEQSTPTVLLDETTEKTLTSTMTDEETTHLETTTIEPSSEHPTTHVESKPGPTRTTQNSDNADEDYIPSSTLIPTITAESTTLPTSNTIKPKVKKHAKDSKETTRKKIRRETITDIDTDMITTPSTTEAPTTELQTELTTEVKTEPPTEEATEITTTAKTTEQTTTEENTEPTTTEFITPITTTEATETSTEEDEEIATTTTVKATKKKKLKMKEYKVKKKYTFFPPVKVDVQNNVDKNFIELGKVYYNKKKDKKHLKEYRVFEIPANESPFIDKDEPVSEGPHFVPVYNYSEANAYFNPTNRLGLNADDDLTEQVEHVGAFSLADQDNDVLLQEILKQDVEAQNYDMEYADTSFNSQRKKFGSNQKHSHNIHKMPSPDDSSDKQRGKVNPDDYLDSDYYFGKIRKDFKSYRGTEVFPNSHEVKHTRKLKDHVRAIRTMMFQQQLFGPIAIGRSFPEDQTQSKKKLTTVYKAEKYLRNGIDRDNDEASADYTGYSETNKKQSETQTQNDNGSDNLKRVGYLNNENGTRSLYALDKYFKDNVMNYIHKLKNKNKGDKADEQPGTAKPYPALYEQMQSKDSGIQRYRDQEKKLDAEFMKIPDDFDKPNKVFSIAESHKIDTVKNTISISNKKDVFFDIQQMQELKLKLFRRSDDVKIGVYLEVLKDMITLDNKALKQYDWLGTTVDIQSALQKIFELIALLRSENPVHPGDMEIIKYVIFLHKVANEIRDAGDFGPKLRQKYALPRNKKKKNKPRFLKKKGLLERVWLHLRKEVPEGNQNVAMKNLNKFLMDLEDGLFDLHDAIKNIAKVTKYKNQHWYQNLKDLYLNADDKHLLELLLHMSVCRLFGLIEESARTGLEDDYVQYMKENKKEAKRTLDELLFVMQILEEINKNVE